MICLSLTLCWKYCVYKALALLIFTVYILSCVTVLKMLGLN